MSIAEKIQSAGVVGAGGAGFPAHVKASSRVDTVIANGAECEPLIHKDYELMVRHADRVVHGVGLLMESTGAASGIIGVKKKTPSPLRHLKLPRREARSLSINSEIFIPPVMSTFSSMNRQSASFHRRAFL
jgi:Na+-translocating ferredoxin:NAD+ oxidoreductase RnfC subunit